jgi:hypothetical protein
MSEGRSSANPNLLHLARQSAYVVVRFDHMRLPRLCARGLDHVRVNRPLRQPLYVPKLCRLLVENLDEHSSDDLAFRFRIRLPGKRFEKTPLRIDANHAHTHVLRESGHHLIGLAEAQQPMIDEHTGELGADGAMQERRQHRGIDSSGEPQQHPVGTHLPANTRHAVLDDVARRPGGRAAGDLPHEPPQDFAALQGMRHLGMKLQGVQAP